MKWIGFALMMLGIVAVAACSVAVWALTLKMPTLHGYVLGFGAGLMTYSVGTWLLWRSKRRPKDPEASC